jgi:hypothetical protein
VAEEAGKNGRGSEGGCDGRSVFFGRFVDRGRISGRREDSVGESPGLRVAYEKKMSVA